MKQQVKDYIDSLIYGGDNFQGDIIDLSDEQKDTLVLEWLLAYPSWQDDYIPAFLCNSKRVGYLRLLYKCNDPASQMLKDEMYLSLESTMRDLIEEYYQQEHTNLKPEPFAGYERGQ
jgi:hypothetical protein